MSSHRDILQNILEDLGNSDFKMFKLYLSDKGVFKGVLEQCEPIPKSQLETSDRPDTMDKMIDNYGDHTLEVTRKALKRMKMKSLWEKHSKSISELGDSGGKSPVLEDPPSTLETLRVDHAGEQKFKPALMRYWSQLQLDTNSMRRTLKLSKNMKSTSVEEEQPYPDHPDRFDIPQLLCGNDLSGRCYWEVEWSGNVSMSVSYRVIRRKGDSEECWFGGNHQSWSLECSDGGYFVRHNNRRTPISSSSSSSSSSSFSSSSSSSRVGVYVDYPAGSLSFFRVSSDSVIHLYTFNTTFTEPLTAGFTLWSGSSVSLCPL